jgi:hypothetical protein
MRAEDDTRSLVIGLAAAVSLVAASLSSSADEFLATVIRELPQAAVSLQQALKTSESEGSPISAEFDVEDGELQISVYTSQGEQFDEVTIDPKSGAVKSAKPLSDAKEINDAQAQSAALRKSKLPLSAALNAAVDANIGYRAVSIIPMLGDNEVVASITLLKGNDIKKVTEKLD